MDVPSLTLIFALVSNLAVTGTRFYKYMLYISSAGHCHFPLERRVVLENFKTFCQNHFLYKIVVFGNA